ncbi:hypothetical protein C5S53_06655 [Methanophagales archaeon]|nr:hypothetical protein C5S53_06655 [Methanophagales archaeon]
MIKRHTVSVLKKHGVRLAFYHLSAIDRFAHRGGDLSAATKVTNENMRAIAKAVRGRKEILLICGDHETHLKDRKVKQASHGKAPASVPLIVGCP